MSGDYAEAGKAVALGGIFGAWKTFRRSIRMAALAAFLGLVLHGIAGAEAPEITFRTSPLTVATAAKVHRFTVELAETDAQRTRGLMFRTALAPDRGMLFDFQRPTYIGMWMRNTLIPLDMLFIDAGGHITYIRENATPGSLEVIQPPDRNRYVLELAGGTAARLGIRPGDRIEHAWVK